MKLNTLYIFFISLLVICNIKAQPCGVGSLPSSLPNNLTELEIVNKKIAMCFAPTIHHMTSIINTNSANGRADLITSVFYDGDFNTGNNWENLVNFSTSDPALHPVVYHSVVWTNTDWIITYGFYHPRDYSATDFLCCLDNHENDFEGAIFAVSRSTFNIRRIRTISHGDLLSFDGTGGSTLFIDNATHAVEANIGNNCISSSIFYPCDDCKPFSEPHIIYVPSSNGLASLSITTSGFNVAGTGSYIIEDIFGVSTNSLNSHRNNLLIFRGDKFTSLGTSECMDNGNGASAPWGWDQFRYTSENIFDIVFPTEFPTPIVTIYNPYFPTVNLPVCDQPRNIHASMVNDFSAKIEWDAVIGTNNYIVRYKPKASGVWSIPIITSSTIFELSNLTDNTEYEVEIKSSCNETPSKFNFATACIVCPCIPQDVVINVSQTLNQTMISGNLIIGNGAVLTINNDMTFNSNSSVIVEKGAKLIIDHAKLSSCNPLTKWNGIKVAGEFIYFSGFPITTVELINGASIENAKIAIDGLDNLELFGINYDFGGAKISLSNSTINNCDIGIQFGPAYFDDLSNIDVSAFSNNNLAISMIQNKGCEIKNTTFGGNDLDIKANTSSFLADYNVFNGGIELESLYPNFEGSTLINNEFVNIDESNIGIKIDAQSNATDFVIQNNIFYGVGILSMGELDFDIAKNDFYDGIVGVSISDSGDEVINDIENNNFVNNKYSNSIYGVNDIEFLTNCFESIDEYSIELYHDASVHITQGNQFNSAGNCFQNSIPLVTGDNTGYFDYYTKEPFTFLQSCKNPGTGNFGVQQASIESLSDNCGTGINIFGSIPPRYRDCNYYNFTDLKQMIVTLRSEIKRIESATNISLWVKKWLIAKHKRCLDRWIKLGSKDIMENLGKDSVITFLTTQPEFRYKTMAYGILNKYRVYADSRTLLNSLNPANDAENDFVTAQNMFLNYLTDRKNYKLSERDKSVLYQAGTKSNTMTGFARTIYYNLTGESIKFNFPHLNNSTPRNKNMDETNNIQIYPNPVINNEITIEIKDFESEKIYRIEFWDVYGKLIQSSKINLSKENINLNPMLKGVILVRIIKEDIVLFQQKVISY